MTKSDDGIVVSQSVVFVAVVAAVFIPFLWIYFIAVYLPLIHFSPLDVTTNSTRECIWTDVEFVVEILRRVSQWEEEFKGLQHFLNESQVTCES